MTDQSAVVVLEPTEDMLKAGRDAAQSAHAHSVGWTDEVRSVWSAMIAAAPKPTLSGEAREVRKVACDHCQRMTVVPPLSSPLPGEE